MKLTDKELTAIEHLNHEAHRTIEATAKLAERARGPVTEDAAEEARLSKALSEHRRAIFKGVHAIQERLGLDWVDLRTRWPSKADELADALTKALKAEAALGTCPDHQLDARLGDQSTAVAKLNALVFRARRLLAAGGDETLPAWIEGSNVREGNLDTAIAEAAAAVDKAHSLEAEAKAARKAAEEKAAYEAAVAAQKKKIEELRQKYLSMAPKREA